MLEHVLEGVDVVKMNGEFTEEWFDQRGVVQDEGLVEKKQKDIRSPHRRRTLLLTSRGFQSRLAAQRQEEEKEEEAQLKSADRRAKMKATRDRNKEDEGKREQALRVGPLTVRKDDSPCLLCGVTFYAYVDHGLAEHEDEGGTKRNQWKQCEGCSEWFCPVHTNLLMGASGHEKACVARKPKRKSKR